MKKAGYVIYDPFDHTQDMFTNYDLRFYVTFYSPLWLSAFVAVSLFEKTKPMLKWAKLR
jgi:hypothetical protein